jgi:hypothetical protein
MSHLYISTPLHVSVAWCLIKHSDIISTLDVNLSVKVTRLYLANIWKDKIYLGYYGTS